MEKVAHAPRRKNVGARTSSAVATSRLGRESDHIVFEGSYEITPFYQRDIEALRALESAFPDGAEPERSVSVEVWSWSISEFDSGFYLIVLGSLLLIELVIHIRHFRNWFLFRTIIRFGGIRGRIEYPRSP